MQEKFKFKNAHISGISVCHIFADFTVVKVCDGAVGHHHTPALPKSEHVTFQRGAGGKVQEKFEFKNAHSVCHISVDFTIVEVCFGGGANIDATALPKSEYVTFQRGDRGRLQKVEKRERLLRLPRGHEGRNP